MFMFRRRSSSLWSWTAVRMKVESRWIAVSDPSICSLSSANSATVRLSWVTSRPMWAASPGMSLA